MDSAVLQCIICPGQPRFSDVSHLLTHVASKAHLSYYFKLQVRSHGEAQANELLAEYDDWYGTNSLAQLLSDRMTSKEDRKQKRKSQLKKTVDSKIQHTQRRSRRSNPKELLCPEAPAFPDFLDPRLAESPEQVKRGSSTQYASLNPIYATPATSAVADANTTMQMDTDFGLVSTPPIRTVAHEEHGRKSGCADMGNAVLPETPKRFRTRGRPNAISLAMDGNIPDPFMDEMRTEVSDEIDADKERADEIARLKGILWPGMDIFDSATQQMRRKRNQKKDRSVLKMMELTSLQVEPTELIFSPTGVFRKQRMISGNVEDDTPLKGETPIPKRRISRPKKEILRQADPNLPRAQDRKRAKKIVKNNRNRKGLETFDINDRSPCRFSGGLKGLNPSYDDDSEIGLALQAFGKRRGNGFTIFADGDGPETELNDRSGHSNIPRDNLTPARLILNHKSDVSNHVAKSGQIAQDKENIEPIMNARGRIDFQDWHSPFPRQSDTDNAGYAPRYYFDEPPYGSLGPEDGSNKTGHQSNPLLAPSSKLGYYEASPYGNEMTINPSDWTTTHIQHRAVSSEATISEQDQHDLARLYLATNAD
ncbi:hypothetical protein N7486_001831 [Penicillium sp. IBT 16267x]|nr:hypothetical protein N7486_001831 [Penicillium sp. IBT 16267x]